MRGEERRGEESGGKGRGREKEGRGEWLEKGLEDQLNNGQEDCEGRNK